MNDNIKSLAARTLQTVHNSGLLGSAEARARQPLGVSGQVPLTQVGNLAQPKGGPAGLVPALQYALAQLLDEESISYC
jgi:hypothetical protein